MGRMSNDDDIERLLREVEGVTGGGTGQAATPAKRQENLPEKRSGGGEPMILVISAVIGIVGWLLGFLPFVNGMWLGIGGFLGAFIALNIGRRLG